MKKKMKAPVCDGNCLRLKCTRCLKKRAKQAVDRADRQAKRHSTQAAGTPSAQTHAKVEADETQQHDEAEDEDVEELFDEWAPGRIRATPERPLFPPTPPSTARK